MSSDSTKNHDDSLFMSEMTNVTPLKPDNRIKVRKKPKIAPHQHVDATSSSNMIDVFSDAEIAEECPETLSYSASGLQHKVIKKLRRGQYTIEHELDLHGLTVIEARKALMGFLEKCETASLRHIIIVHGKGFGSRGKPVIKPMINRWLRATDQVLAFHSAQPHDGGTGAVYVLLRKSTID